MSSVWHAVVGSLAAPAHGPPAANASCTQAIVIGCVLDEKSLHVEHSSSMQSFSLLTVLPQLPAALLPSRSAMHPP